MFSGMEQIIQILERNAIKLEQLKALEVFGRGGDWHTKKYANKVYSLEIWEIDDNWKDQLHKNFPNATIKFHDSIKYLQCMINLDHFDLIVIDNPQVLFGPIYNDQPTYCEHFEVLHQIGKLIHDESIVIFNVNLKPYNYEKFPEWERRRKQFYGNTNTSDLDIEFLINFYVQFFTKLNLITRFNFYVKRVTPNPIEKLYYLVYDLKLINKISS